AVVVDPARRSRPLIRGFEEDDLLQRRADLGQAWEELRKPGAAGPDDVVGLEQVLRLARGARPFPAQLHERPMRLGARAYDRGPGFSRFLGEHAYAERCEDHARFGLEQDPCEVVSPERREQLRRLLRLESL